MIKHHSKYLSLLLAFLFSIGLCAQTARIKQRHQVKKKETLYGISKQYGITVEELTQVNPEMRMQGYELKKGDYINIPFAASDATAAQSSPATQAVPVNKEVSKTGQVVRVGVMLPLHNLNGDGRRMTEYYRGLLMAGQRLKQDNISTEIYTWNVPIDADINKTLKEKGADKCDVIFGPLYTSMVKPLAEFCKSNNIKLVIPFSIFGQPAKNYDMVYQIYQSGDDLIAMTINSFLERFKDYHPIFVDCNDETSDKGKFTATLRKALESKGISYALTNLNSDDDAFAKAFSRTQKNVVIINTSKSPELNATFAKLNKMTAKGIGGSISMLGYTEWLMYTSVYQTLFHKYDTYIPTNFFYNPETADTKWLESNYRKWFNEDMLTALPHFALTGFDHGCFFIGGLHKYGKAFNGKKGEATYKYVQTPLNFRKEGKGWQNKSFMFIHYQKDKTIESISY